MARATPKEATFLLACGVLVWDPVQAGKHHQTCPQCAGRDFLDIALDVGHLIRAA
jgi:hypothetical protein